VIVDELEGTPVSGDGTAVVPQGAEAFRHERDHVEVVGSGRPRALEELRCLLEAALGKA
jgi:hypothetical protein